MEKGVVYKFYKDLPGWAKGVSVVITFGIIALGSWGIYKWSKNRPPKVTYPDGGQGIPAGWNPEPYATKAHDEMQGLNITIPISRNAILMQIAGLPTNDMFVSVYDVFNQKYMSEGNGTFREWVNAEFFAPGTGNVKDTINNRFDILNLK